MTAYGQEFRHLLRSPTAIAIAVLAVLGGVVVYSAVGPAVSGPTLDSSAFLSRENDSFHLDAWVFDSVGRPVGGVRLDFSLRTEQYPLPIGPPVPVATEVTDAQGRVTFTVPLPQNGSPSEALAATVQYPGHPGTALEGALGQYFLLSSVFAPEGSDAVQPLAVVADGFYSTRPAVAVTWMGPNGIPPSDEQVVACDVVGSYAIIVPANCSGLPSQTLGSLVGYRGVFVPPQLALPGPLGQAVTLVELRNASGAVQAEISYNAGTSSGSPGPVILSDFGETFDLFVPVMAVLAAYWVYVRPRLSGTVEPVLARPVTRSRLYLLRYGTVALLLAIVAGAEVAYLDVAMAMGLRAPLPGPVAGALVGGLLVAGLGFLGLMFLSAHAFHAPGAVLSIGIGLLVVLALFWNYVGLIVAFLYRVPLSSLDVVHLLGRADLLAPAQFPSLVTELTSGLSSGGVSGVNYAAIGVTAPLVALVGALWVAVPFLGGYRRARTAD